MSRIMSLADLPDELFTDLILPNVGPKWILSLSQVSKRMNKLAKDTQFFNNKKYSVKVKENYRNDITIIQENWRYLPLKVVIRDLSIINDIQEFRNVHTLDLSGCPNITDVSALGNVHTLDISGCTGITDYSVLTNVTHLIR